MTYQKKENNVITCLFWCLRWSDGSCSSWNRGIYGWC